MPSRLSRRAALALGGSVVSTGLAGCGRPPPLDVQRVVTLAAVDPVPEEADVVVGVEQLTSEMAPRQPAGFRVTIINLARRKRVGVAPKPECCRFNRDRGGSTPTGLWLHHADD